MQDAEQFRRAKQLFFELASVPRCDRPAELRARTTDDPALRAEVKKLLTIADDTIPDLEHNVFGQPIDRDHAGGSGMAGQVVGDYFVRRRLARGGMAVVFEARHRYSGRRVALKLIRPDSLSETNWRRLHYEAEILARLDHPGIARIYEAGVASTAIGDQPFVAMELIDGPPLLDFARAQKIDFAGRIRLLIRICGAVQHAHYKGVIHRDLKPANILVTSAGEPKVVDFGIARMTDVDLRRLTLQTQQGHLLGTLPYMSPEQLAGDSRVLDARSDIYTLGVVGYELLSGSLPYEGAANSIAEMLRVIQDSRVLPFPVSQALMGRDIQHIFDKALQNQPDRRYNSAAELADDLSRHVNRRPVLAHPVSMLYRVQKFVRRYRTPVIASTACVVLILAGSIGWSMHARAAKATRDKQVIRLFLERLLTFFHPFEEAAHLPTEAQLDRAAREAELLFGEMPKVKLHFDYVVGKIYLSMGRFRVAERHARAALHAAETILDPDDPTLAEILILNAGCQHEGASELAVPGSPGDSVTARSERAIAYQRKALAIRHAHFGPTSEPYARALISLANYYNDLCRWKEAENTWQAALAAFRGIPGHESLLAKTLYGFASHKIATGQYDAASRVTRQAVELAREHYGGDTLLFANALRAMGWTLHHLGDLRGAMAVNDQEFNIRRQHVASDHPEIARSLRTRAGLLWQYGCYDESLEMFREIPRILTTTLSSRHPQILENLSNQGVVLRDLGQYSAAEVLLEDSLEYRRKRFGEEHTMCANALANLANLRCLEGKYDEAASLFRECLRLRRRLLPDGHNDIAEPLMGLGNISIDRGEFDTANIRIREALEIRSAALPKDHWLVGEARNALGASLYATQPDEARALLIDGYVIIMRKLHPENRMAQRARRRIMESLGEDAVLRAIQSEYDYETVTDPSWIDCTPVLLTE